jgi:hypothetical protein
MVSGVNAPGSGGGQSRPKRCAENAYQWTGWTHAFGPDGRERPAQRRSAHSGYRHLAEKDEAGGSSPPGPLPAMTSGNTSKRLRNPLGRPSTGSRTLTWLPLLVMDVAPSLRTGPFGRRPAARTALSEPSTTCLVGLASPTLTGQLSAGPSGAPRRGCAGRCAFGSPLHQDRAPAGLTAGRVRCNCDAAPAWPCPLAWWVGRSLATRPRR